MKITLLGLEFANSNMGCQALGYAFVKIFEDAATKLGEKCEYVAVAFGKFNPIELHQYGCTISFFAIDYKSIAFWKKLNELFKESRLIVDFTGGDSFSDIYGGKRFFLATMVKRVAISSGTPFMLGPQTYGPYVKKWCRRMASSVIRKSTWVFARDRVSAEKVREISSREAEVTTDVAFSLDYEKQVLPESGSLKVGINVSGLLWDGGYSKGILNLTVDYKQYCKKIIGFCHDMGYEVYLIPHVGVAPTKGFENDYNASVLLRDEFPFVKIVDGIKTPMDAKGYISAMDVFIGARMHATIGAFSSGVATIPFSYSRKFEGLYSNLGYPYIISAQKCCTEEAISKTIEWIEKYRTLMDAVNEAKGVISNWQSGFSKRLEEIIEYLKG